MIGSTTSSRAQDSGVTLLEVLVVLGIITMIAAMAAPRLLDSFGRAKGQVAQVQIQNVKAALQLYYLDVGRYPTEAENLRALTADPGSVKGWDGPYIDEADLLDPWKRPLVYHSPGEDRPFELITLGRDGQPGGSKEDKDIRL